MGVKKKKKCYSKDMNKIPVSRFVQLTFLTLAASFGSYILCTSYLFLLNRYDDSQFIGILIGSLVFSILGLTEYDLIKKNETTFQGKKIPIMIAILLTLAILVGGTLPSTLWAALDPQTRSGIEFGGIMYFINPLILYGLFLLPLYVAMYRKLVKLLAWSFILLLLYLPLFFLSEAFFSQIFTLAPWMKASDIASTINRPSPTQEFKLVEGKIAYIKENSVFILTPKGSQKISPDTALSTVRSSSQGRYIGWISTTKINGDSTISLMDFQKNEVLDVITKKVTSESQISDFDFSPDESQIAYVYDGVRLFNLTTGEDKILKTNKLVPRQSIANETYGQVSWSPHSSELLLKKYLWETSITEIFNMDTGLSYRLPDYSVDAFWSTDGKKVVYYRSGGRDKGILGLLDPITHQNQLILGNLKPGNHWENVLSVHSAAQSASGKFIATLDTYADLRELTITPTPVLLPYKNMNIYTVTSRGEVNILSKSSLNTSSGYIFDLRFSPDGRYVTYLFGSAYEDKENGKTSLRIIDTKTNTDHVLVNSAVSDYSWLPQ